MAFIYVTTSQRDTLIDMYHKSFSKASLKIPKIQKLVDKGLAHTQRNSVCLTPVGKKRVEKILARRKKQEEAPVRGADKHLYTMRLA